MPRVVRFETAMVSMDVRISASAVHLVVDSLARAALATTAGNMRRADLTNGGTESATTPGGCCLVHLGKATAILADVGVPTSAVCVVDFSSTCSCQDAHTDRWFVRLMNLFM